ncbi:hypothetical protein C1890_32850 [Pseudomonas sp. DP16D-R1]|nr:hypothetical protein C1890_32850 [Pseudomonas sp. DP16D-R1]
MYRLAEKDVPVDGFYSVSQTRVITRRSAQSIKALQRSIKSRSSFMALGMALGRNPKKPCRQNGRES